VQVCLVRRLLRHAPWRRPLLPALRAALAQSQRVLSDLEAADFGTASSPDCVSEGWLSRVLLQPG
jgi:hypothetical protein